MHREATICLRKYSIFAETNFTMKILFTLLTATFFFFSCSNSNADKPGNDSTKKTEMRFGDSITAEGAIKAEMVKEKLGKQDSAAMKVEGTVVDVCRKKGCWMEMQLPNGASMRVTFKDYGFFVPKDISGKTVVVDGYAYNDTTTVAQLRHYAEDGGKSKEEIEKITEPEVAVSFEARGVIIR